MSSRRIVTGRKDYECNFCGQAIKKGEKHEYDKGRIGKIINRRQVGIWFWEARFHLECPDQ